MTTGATASAFSGLSDANQGPRYFLDPFGCVKNQVDAETLMALLAQAGWRPAGDAAEADLLIINSCGFIESAKQESINAVLSYRKAYPHKKILLAGCLAQRYGNELSQSLVEADGFLGNADLAAITRIAAEMLGERPVQAMPVIPGERPLLSPPGSAYVKIAEGCNNRCSFCAIPLIRGSLKSRAVLDIREECRRLLDRGVRELCLIGQDLGAFGSDRGAGGLRELLEGLETLPGDFWVRLLYIHPDHFPLELLPLFQRDPRFLPYFDIPFQHGSPRILRAMGRRGNPQAYLELIETIRRLLPGGVIRSTFMTGFPGETDEDFQALLDFQDRARLDWAGVFVYSREEGTAAYALKGRVPKGLARKRRELFEERQVPITEERMDRLVGRTLTVLAEERIVGEDGLYLGRLACHAPEVDGSAVILADQALTLGSFASAKVLARNGFDLEVYVSG
ncbi:MAG: 30S ribosomal protein S12 methylthiotransferase RimO [Treponema sp.]|jgi:ribosomal protein S12 methylthiotransferase|nr:30S ribosomal protein S12 methylthiotransferase RimO [Treponema sp.]